MEIRKTCVDIVRGQPQRRGRDRTSAVVRHTRGARVLVIHVTPVHCASVRRLEAGRSGAVRNDLGAVAEGRCFLITVAAKIPER